MQLKPGPKSISVCFAKDLKPCMTIRFILVAFESCATARGADTFGMSPSFSMGISLYMYYLKFIVKNLNQARNKVKSLSFAVPFLLVMLHDSPCSNFLCPFAISSRFLCRFFYMLIHPLLF